jgi:hypothetical protein
MTDFETLLLQRLEQIDRKIGALDDKLEQGLTRAYSKIAINTAQVERLDERSKRGRWALYVVGSVVGLAGALYAFLDQLS